MKFLFSAMLFTIVLIGNAWSVCEIDVINRFSHQVYFNDGISVNVPLYTDGTSACYHQKTKLSVVADSVGSLDVDFLITPLIAEFENIPEPKIYQYVIFDREDGNDTTKISIASFICSGENPIGADAMTDSLKRIAENLDKEKEDTNIFISTGKPGDSISVSQEQKAKAKIYDHLVEIYEQRTMSDISDDEVSNLYIPNIVAGFTSNHSNMRKLYTSFLAKTGSSVNGCSKKFLNTMQDLLIDNVGFPGIAVRKKIFSDKYMMKWNI